MSLVNWLNSDTWGPLRDKVNAIITEVNDNSKKALVSSNDTTSGYLNGKLVAGDNVVLTEVNDAGDETLEIDVVERTNDNNSWSGSQALTTSYVNVGTLTYTTPNDGITRRYLIIGEGTTTISSGSGDNVIDLKLINTSDSSDLKSVEVAIPDIGGGSAARIQGSMYYLGDVAPNKTIKVQGKKTTANGVSIISGSMTVIEINR